MSSCFVIVLRTVFYSFMKVVLLNEKIHDALMKVSL